MKLKKYTESTDEFHHPNPSKIINRITYQDLVLVVSSGGSKRAHRFLKQINFKPNLTKGRFRVEIVQESK